MTISRLQHRHLTRFLWHCYLRK